ncbi:MAG: DEAD/DEAH box helicase [Candidatus Nanopelagicales bacterium]
MSDFSRKYSDFRKKQRTTSKLIQEYELDLPFELDNFQREAFIAIESDKNVLVSAPTGSGKTLVADFGIFITKKRGLRSIYTTPIKALSNQKFRELIERYGVENVGLLTGDNSVNKDAPIVVMTTEVLRNMIYEDFSRTLDIGLVVMDEVHYLADRNRGVVWEEVLILLPKEIVVVALSATVSNASEIGDWLTEVRGTTEVIVETKRPIPLEQFVVTKTEIIPLFSKEDSTTLNKNLIRIHQAAQSRRTSKYKRSDQMSLVPSQEKVISQLRNASLLPAIYFIFSRKQCDVAVENLLSSKIRLTSDAESLACDKFIEQVLQALEGEDWNLLGIDRWQAAVRRGFAAHHAGLLPVIKETTEKLFQNGLIKLVFATDTLALGINMPARSVVLDKLDKWNGETHELLTAAEYTQITGRAGRRGIDNRGASIICFSRATDPRYLSNLATNRAFELKSSFQPRYNMVCGLLEKRTIAQTEQLLEKSLAQFQAKLKVKKMVTRQRREEEALEKYKNTASCHLGDINEYLSLVKSLAVAQKRNDPEWEVLKKAIRQHPVHGCKDRESHLRWGERRLKLEKQVASLKRDISRDTSGIKRIFKNVLSVLEKFEYLTVSDSENILTNKGELLTKIHSEQDLLLGEAIDRNVFSNLKPSELVSLVSGLTYESRIDQDYEYWLPNEVLNERADELLAISHEIIALEDKHDLSFTSEPDFSFANSVFMWANGASLRKVLKIANMSAGDFVRSMKQNIDLLGQISALENSLAQTAKDALKLINRGVIAQEYVLGVDELNHELIEEVH